jgi:fatty-acyl-CoA synthase
MSAVKPERPAGNGEARSGQSILLDETVAGVLDRQVRAGGGKRAVLWETDGALHALTYAELAERANAVAATLDHLAPGDRVAVWGRNSVEWVLLEYACALRGLVLAPLNTAWTDVEAAAGIELAGPAVLYAGDDSRGLPLAERATRLAGGGIRSLDGLLRLPGAPPAARAVIDADAPFLIQFTSGTTGRSKGAVLSHRAVLNAAYLRERRDVASGGVCLNSVPYHHIGGSLYVILGALTMGGAFVVVDRFDPERTVKLLPLAGVTHLGGVPIMIERVMEQPGIRAAAGTVKTVALGGADISPQLIRRIKDDLGATVLTTYGQSECPMVTCSQQGDTDEQIATTAGRPVEATEVRIIDPATGLDAAPGETGEIAVRSPLVMRGYYRMPERTAEVLPGDGFLRTGDLGSIDSGGYVTIRGRNREVIIRGGENIYPAEVEAALSEHPAVAGCAVVGIADPRWGEIVGASVVPRGNPADPAELESFLAGRLAHFKIPRVWRFTGSLPMTAAGKIRRTEVKEEMNAPAARAAVEDSTSVENTGGTAR